MPFVNRCGDAPKLQTKTVKPTTSQQTITPDDGFDGITQLTVNAPVFQNKTVTADGTVTPDEGYDGIGQLTVDTPVDVYISVSDSAELTSSSNGSIVDTHKRKFFIGDMMSKHSLLPDIIMIVLDNTVSYSSQVTTYIQTLFIKSDSHGIRPDGTPYARWLGYSVQSHTKEDTNGFEYCIRQVVFNTANYANADVYLTENNTYLELRVASINFAGSLSSQGSYIGYFIWGVTSEEGDI